MLDLDELQFLAQIVDSMEMAIERLEKSYQDKEGVNFQNSKKTILEFQSRISEILGKVKKK